MRSSTSLQASLQARTTSAKLSHRLGFSLITTYNSEFQNFFFSALPPSFPRIFKGLVEWTVTHPPDKDLWAAIDQLGLFDRYENMVASVCYEMIEARVKETCVGKWDEMMVPKMRTWMTDYIVPWMMCPYARNAKTREIIIDLLCGYTDIYIQRKRQDLHWQELGRDSITTS